MLKDALANLIAVAADGLAGSFELAMASQDEMRARRADYRARLSSAAAPAIGGLIDELAGATRARLEGWLDHPRLGHGALVDEGRTARNQLQQAIVDHQAGPSPATAFAVALAHIRFDAITSIVGPECIYLEPKIRGGRKKSKKAVDRRMGRRAVTIDDVPNGLVEAVAQLSPGSNARELAIRTLKSAVGGDPSTMAATLLSLANAPGSETFLDDLSRAAAARLVVGTRTTEVTTATEVDKVTGGDEMPPSQPVDRAPAVDEEVENADGNTEVSISDAPPALDPDDQLAAQTVYAFVTAYRWALFDHDGDMRLKPLDRRPDVAAAFKRVGHLPAVQSALRAIYDSPASTERARK